MQKPLRVPLLRPSFSSVLTLGVGLLMLLAGIAFGFAMLSGRLNTVDLLRDRNDRIVSQLVERTELQLDPVQQHVEALRDRLESGRLRPNAIGRLTDRSDERRGGKGWCSKCRSRWSPVHE